MPSFKSYLKKIHTLHLSDKTPIPPKQVLAALCQEFCIEHQFKQRFFNQEPAQLQYFLAKQLYREISQDCDFIVILNRQLALVALDKESDFYYLLKAFFYFYYESYRALDNNARHKFALEFDNLPTNEADISRLVTVLDSNASTQVTIQVINLLTMLHNRIMPATQKIIIARLLIKLSSTDVDTKTAATHALTKLAPLSFESYKGVTVASLIDAMHEPVFAESHIQCLNNIVPAASENFLKTIFNTILARLCHNHHETNLENLFQTLCENNSNENFTSEVKDWVILKLFEKLNFLEKMELYQNTYLAHFKLFRHIAFLASPEIVPTIARYCIRIISEKTNIEITKYSFCILSQIDYDYSIEDKQLIYQYIVVDLRGFCLGVNHAIVRWIKRFDLNDRLGLLNIFFNEFFKLTDDALNNYMPVLGILIRDQNELFMKIARQHLGINFKRKAHWIASNSVLVKAKEFISDSNKKALNELFWDNLFDHDGSVNFYVSYDFRHIVSFFPQEIIHDNLFRLIPSLLTKVEYLGLLDALFVNILLASTEACALVVLKSITLQNDCSKLRSCFKNIIRETSSAAIKKYLTHYFYERAVNDNSWVHWLCYDVSKKPTEITDELELLVLQKDFPEHSLHLALLTLEAYNYKHFKRKYTDKVSSLIM
jgi:hypothetical protein